MTAPLVLGHRGAAREHPENSRAGLRRALELGADGVEIDVRSTLDRQLVVQHDVVPLRTMWCPLPVPWTPFAVLRAFRLRNGERLPTLDEVLELTSGARAVVVDLKDRQSAPGVAAHVLEVDPAGERVHAWSAHPSALRAVRDRAPTIPTTLLMGPRRGDDAVGAMIDAATECGARGINLDPPYVDDASAAAVQQAGLELWSGTTTLDGAERLVTAWRGGAALAGLTTDHPREVRELLTPG
jgi:glycerophosphoryl diester phosphodiesterase